MFRMIFNGLVILSILYLVLGPDHLGMQKVITQGEAITYQLGGIVEETLGRVDQIPTGDGSSVQPQGSGTGGETSSTSLLNRPQGEPGDTAGEPDKADKSDEPDQPVVQVTPKPLSPAVIKRKGEVDGTALPPMPTENPTLDRIRQAHRLEALAQKLELFYLEERIHD